MQRYNLATHTFEEVPNAQDNQGVYKVWELEVMNNSNPNLFYTFQGASEIPICEAKYKKFTLSETVDSRIGKHNRYNIGTITEMSQAEKDIVDYVPTPISEYEQKRQTNIRFGQKLLKTIVDTGNAQGFSREVTAAINHHLLNASDLMTNHLKGFIDSGRADIMTLPITAFFPQEFKDYILGKIQEGFENNEWFVLPQN